MEQQSSVRNLKYKVSFVMVIIIIAYWFTFGTPWGETHKILSTVILSLAIFITATLIELFERISNKK